MTHPLLQELEDLRTQVRKMSEQIPVFRTLEVGTADRDTNTVVLKVPGSRDLPVQPEWQGFFPVAGDMVDVEMRGATPVLRPGRIGAGAVGEDELGTAVKEQIVAAYEAGNGKNQVFFSITDPPGAGVSGSTTGDVFFQKDIYGLGVIVASWEWSGTAWVPKFFGDSVLNSLTVGKLVSGTGTFDMLMAGSLYNATSGNRYRLDAAGLRFYSGSNPVPTIDFNTVTGVGTLRSVILENALFRTQGTGQRLQIDSGGTAGGRTLTFYPAGAGQPATVSSRDDTAGNAGVSMEAGGTNRGFVNFASGFADIGYRKGTGSASFIRVSDDPYAVAIGVEAGHGLSIATTEKVDFYSGLDQFAKLSAADGLQRVYKFSLAGRGGNFTFGINAGESNADIYALRFVSTNPGSTGGFVYFSDKRLKKNFKPATFDALAEVMATPVEEFEWKATGEKSFGFQAQNMPVDVRVQLDPDQPIDGIDNPVGLSLEQLIAKAWKAVQQLNTKVDNELVRGKK